MSQPSSSSRHQQLSAAGFTIVELLIAMAILGVILWVSAAALTRTLEVRGREVQLVEVQQNLRSALQLVSQDLRAGSFMHVWNDSACSSGVCSGNDRIAIVTTDGVRTSIPEPPGNSYNNSAITGVCDARGFSEGDLAIIYSGEDSMQLVEVTHVNLHADHTKPCSGPPGTPNRDQLQHNNDRLTGQWSTANYVFRAVVATYSLEPDPLEPERTVLYRRTGLSSEQEESGIVAFNVSDVSFTYGVPVDPTAAASELIFFPTLAEAAAALGSDYSSFPRTVGKSFVGKEVRAVRVTLTGTTPHELRSTGEHHDFTLTETVEMRR